MNEKELDIVDSLESIAEDLHSEAGLVSRIAAAALKLKEERDKAIEENIAWRKATGRDDPEVLDSYLGRGGIDSHFNVLNELLKQCEAKRDKALADNERLRESLASWEATWYVCHDGSESACCKAHE